MAAHERYKSLQISSCPLQNFALSEERERRRLIFLKFLCLIQRCILCSVSK